MQDLKRRFHDQYPRAFFLNADEPDTLERHLKQLAWISADEKIQEIATPGQGNMNRVLRVRTDRQTLIVKQARPWVERYPHIDAPVNRVAAEAAYYRLQRDHPELTGHTPRLLGYDPANFLLVLEDLGENADFLRIYGRDDAITADELHVLIQYISLLHNTDFRLQGKTFPDNTQLRTLNHEHVFAYPYAVDNGFDLDTIQEGLQNASMAYKNDPALKQRAKELGRIYMATGPRLLHGDYYPGSWLSTRDGIRILDPEFAYFGRPEFDIGVMHAHLKMAETPKDNIRTISKEYHRPDGFDDNLARAFCGIEILRRIIGLAQLPLDLTLPAKIDLLEQARHMILG
jgi:5-methylthioribose kinase